MKKTWLLYIALQTALLYIAVMDSLVNENKDWRWPITAALLIFTAAPFESSWKRDLEWEKSK